jgi:hypothetical protein
VIKLWQWDEKFLPHKGISNFHYHSNEFVNKLIFVFGRNMDVLDSYFELW